MPSKIITQEQEISVCEYYKSKPMTLEELSDFSGLCKPTVAKILDKYSIGRYTKSKLYNPNLDERYFKDIDTQEKAYFLGLIITDGNVFTEENSGRQTSISITLQDSDSYLLMRFKDALHSKTSINKDGRGSSTLAVRSNLMAGDLKELGVTERKSLYTTLPMISDKLMSHLIRGIFDGDGCVQARQNSIKHRYKHAAGFCGTNVLMTQIRDYLVRTLNLKGVSVYSYTNRPLSMVTWGSVSDIQVLYHYLYNDASIYMYRKEEKFRDILAHYNLK